MSAPALTGKWVHCLRPAPGKTPDSFRRWWLERHSRILREFAAVRGLRRYVQNHTLDPWASRSLGEGRGQTYIGFTMTSWDSPEDRLAAEGTPDGKHAMRLTMDDSGSWVDRQNSNATVTAEYILFGGRPVPQADGLVPGVKFVTCLQRRPDVSPAAFADWWIDAYPELIEEYASVLGIRRYAQSIALPENPDARPSRGRPAPYDGFAESWYDSLQDEAEAKSTPDGLRAQKALYENAKRFIDPSESVRLGVREYVFVDR